MNTEEPPKGPHLPFVICLFFGFLLKLSVDIQRLLAQSKLIARTLREEYRGRRGRLCLSHAANGHDSP